MRLRKGELPPLTGIYTECKICLSTKDDALFKYQGGKRAGLVCRACDLEAKRKLYKSDEDSRDSAKLRSKVWLENNKERAKLSSAKYRLDNREELLAKKRKYQQDNKLAENARCTKWYQDNKHSDVYKRKIAEYRANNKELIASYGRIIYSKMSIEVRRAKGRDYRLKNPHMVAYYCRKYELDKELRTVGWANESRIKSIYRYCPEGFDVDHIVPLRGKLVSGLHCEDNLQYLSKSANARKSNMFYPDEFDNGYEPMPNLLGFFDGRNCKIPEGYETEYFMETPIAGYDGYLIDENWDYK